MATLITPTNEYRQRVQALLKQYAQQATSADDIETQLIFDTEGDHYQLANIGWQKHRRIYGCIMSVPLVIRATPIRIFIALQAVYLHHRH